MKESEYYGTMGLTPSELKITKGGIPILVVIGAVTTVVSAGKILDQAGEWFLQGWNNPK